MSWVGKANKSSFWRLAKEHKSNKTVTATLSSNSSITSLLSRRTSTLTVNAEKVTKSEEYLFILFFVLLNANTIIKIEVF